MKQAKVIFDKDYTVGEVDKRITSSFVEHLGRCLYNGLYQPEHPSADKNGFREDVKELIRELGVTAVRYPGGNFVSGYDWKDGVGPKEKRPHKKELAWGVIETNEVGMNEFADFLQDIGAEMIMAANLGTGTPKEAGELVDYCNTESGTCWSDLRRKHGVEKPHRFHTWCLGNEMDGEWQICSMKPMEYARKAKEAAKIMKWMDPSIECIACGSCTSETFMGTYGEWDRIVLEEAYSCFEYLSLHRYFNYRTSKEDDVSDVPYFFKDLENYLSMAISAADFVKQRLRSDKTIYISFDEWGVVTPTSASIDRVNESFGYASFHELDAVIYGGILCTFLNHADRVKIACQSLLVNEGGMISTQPEGKAIRQSTYYPFQHVAKYGRGTALQGVFSMPKEETRHHGEQETVKTAAVYNEAKKELTVFAMNCSLTEDAELQLDLRSFPSLSALEKIVLYHENPYAVNTFEKENEVIPHIETLEEPKCGKLSTLLKKHSWNVLRFTCD